MHILVWIDAYVLRSADLCCQVSDLFYWYMVSTCGSLLVCCCTAECKVSLLAVRVCLCETVLLIVLDYCCEVLSPGCRRRSGLENVFLYTLVLLNRSLAASEVDYGRGSCLSVMLAVAAACILIPILPRQTDI